MSRQPLSVVFGLALLQACAKSPGAARDPVDDPAETAADSGAKGASATPVPPASTASADTAPPLPSAPKDAAVGLPSAPAGGDAATAAPAPDAGRSDVVAGSAQPQVECKAAKFCDDFESYRAGEKPGGDWNTSARGGTLTVESGKAFSGGKAVLVTVPSGLATAAVYMSRAKGLLPFADNVMHGRMMIYLETLPGGDVHWQNIDASGPLPAGGTGHYYFGGFYETYWPSYQPNHCWKFTNTKFVAGKWVCLQWQFDGSKDAAGVRKGEMHYWLDGAPRPEMTITSVGSGCTVTNVPWIAPNFEKLSLGWEHYQAPKTPVRFWMDDVAVDSKPIACPQQMP